MLGRINITIWLLQLRSVGWAGLMAGINKILILIDPFCGFQVHCLTASYIDFNKTSQQTINTIEQLNSTVDVVFCKRYQIYKYKLLFFLDYIIKW